MKTSLSTMAFAALAALVQTVAAAAGDDGGRQRGAYLVAGFGCADCHTARVAFRDPETSHTSSMGAVAGRFGVRNAPSRCRISDNASLLAVSMTRSAVRACTTSSGMARATPACTENASASRSWSVAKLLVGLTAGSPAARFQPRS